MINILSFINGHAHIIFVQFLFISKNERWILVKWISWIYIYTNDIANEMFNIIGMDELLSLALIWCAKGLYLLVIYVTVATISLPQAAKWKPTYYGHAHRIFVQFLFISLKIRVQCMFYYKHSLCIPGFIRWMFTKFILIHAQVWYSMVFNLTVDIIHVL